MTNEEILENLKSAFCRAQLLHPGFAEGIFHALGCLSEEHGEVVRAITKNEGKQRMQEELIDLIVVAWRMLRDEHERADSCIQYGRRGLSGKCPGFDPRDHKSDFEDAAEFEARVAALLATQYFKWFEHPCECGDGTCHHLPCPPGKEYAPHRLWCRRWCKIKFARLAVEQEMEEQ